VHMEEAVPVDLAQRMPMPVKDVQVRRKVCHLGPCPAHRHHPSDGDVDSSDNND